jgi:hypothetical protein
MRDASPSRKRKEKMDINEADRLETLIKKARPLLKDLNAAIKYAKTLREDYLKLAEMANQRLRDAIEQYKVVKGLDEAVDKRLEDLLESLEIIQREVKKLERLQTMHANRKGI